jgi:dolichol-phosphate mannosyltransferase
MNKKLISIVTPAYNEEDSIEKYFSKVIPVIDSLKEKYDFEIIFTNNASTDQTANRILKYKEKYPYIGLINFSKNFGYQSSLLSGYLNTSGDAVFELDCDLQDPPEMLRDFLIHWENGYKIVYGIRKSRKEGFVVTQIRKTFYRLINLISADSLPHDAGDFMLIDRDIVNNLKIYNSSRPYLRGLIFSQGYKKIGIPYNRLERSLGESKFPFIRMFGLGIDGIISQSILPLRMATYIGASFLIISIFLIVFYLFLFFFSSIGLPKGFTTIVILLLTFLGINSLFLGIIGEYLARIYIQTRNDPMVIIDEKISPSHNIR